MGGAELQMSRIRAGLISYKVYVTTTSWSTKYIFLKVVKFKCVRNWTSVAQSKIRFGIGDLDYIGIHYF